MATTLGDRAITISSDRAAIYAGAIIEGAILAMFAAYTGTLINRYNYALNRAQFGFLFVPLLVTAVLVTLFSGEVGCRICLRRAHLAGILCSLVAMGLLIATEWAQRLPVSYPLLLASSAFVGAGFGLTAPILRSLAVSSRLLETRQQILLLNGSLAAGMALAPAYALITAGSGVWWSLPVILAVLLVAGLFRCRSLREPSEGAPAPAGRRAPAGLHLYPWLVMVYGVCAVICITSAHHLTSSPTHIPLTVMALMEAAFWAPLVAGSRVLFAVIDGMKARQYLASLVTFLAPAVVFLCGLIVGDYRVMHIGIYLLAGIACAALLPINTRPDSAFIAMYPLAATAGVVAMFPIGLGLTRFVYDLAHRGGVTDLEVFTGVAVLGALACVALLPIIRSWPTLAYFDQPGSRWTSPPGRLAVSPAAPSLLMPPPPRPPSERPQQGHPGTRRSGATALPRHPEQDSRRRGL